MIRLLLVPGCKKRPPGRRFTHCVCCVFSSVISPAAALAKELSEDKVYKIAEGFLVPDKAEDAGGLAPGKDDNAVWQQKDSARCKVYSQTIPNS
jgi:hypothetical protein